MSENIFVCYNSLIQLFCVGAIIAKLTSASQLEQLINNYTHSTTYILQYDHQKFFLFTTNLH